MYNLAFVHAGSRLPFEQLERGVEVEHRVVHDVDNREKRDNRTRKNHGSRGEGGGEALLNRVALRTRLRVFEDEQIRRQQVQYEAHAQTEPETPEDFPRQRLEEVRVRVDCVRTPFERLQVSEHVYQQEGRQYEARHRHRKFFHKRRHH